LSIVLCSAAPAESTLRWAAAPDEDGSLPEFALEFSIIFSFKKNQ
jgi:hypothetical protein